MTTPQLLQQAKQGDPDAIAQLMNQSLETKGIKATVSRQADLLKVLLNSENELNQSLLTQFIYKGIQNLNIPGVTTVEVTGQSQSAGPWIQTLALQSSPPILNTPPAPQVPPPPTQQIQSNVAENPGLGAPAISSDSLQDDLDLSAAALDDDFSLDDELSMAEIDQIVAEAVKEVTTKIQSEIPFNPNADLEQDVGLYDLPQYSTEATSDQGLPTDDAIRQAMQADNLDGLIEQELAQSDAVTIIEQESEAGIIQGSIPAQSEFQPLQELGQDADSQGSQADIKPMDDPSMANRVDDPNAADGIPDSSTRDTGSKPASRVLWVLVSLITFGSIAALIGYSLQAYATNGGNLLAFPPSLPDQGKDDVNETDGAASEENTQAATDGSAVDAVESAGEGEEADGNDEEEAIAAAPSDIETEAAESQSSVSEAEESASDSETEASDAAATDTSGTAAIANLDCPMILGGNDITVAQIVLNPDIEVKNETYPVMGCLTNHTDTPIVSAVLKYQGQPIEVAADIVPQDEWSLSSTNEGISRLAFDEIQPKSTIVFMAEIPVAEGTTSVEFNSLAWRPEGWSGDAKSLELNFSIPLSDE
ncbi:MAG: hypothetical protein AAGD25_39955 [Cyanobacteria bacterium P01_F01_bin.150]